MPIIKYKDIFRVLIEEGVIPIALYRDIDGYLENNQRYIVTNPDPEIVILKDDIILVLGDTVDSKKKRLRAQTKSVNINFMKKLSAQLSFQQEPENQDKPQVEPEGSPGVTPVHSDSLNPEVVTLEQIQPHEKQVEEESEAQAIDRSESLQIPQQIDSHSMSRIQLSSNMPPLAIDSVNISRIEARGEPNMLGEEFKKKSASMSRLPRAKSNLQDVNDESDDASDYDQLDDETILLLISEQLKHSTRDRQLLKEQQNMLHKLKRGRVMQKVRQFVENLKRSVRRSRQMKRIQEEAEFQSQVDDPAPSDSMSQAISSKVLRKAVRKEKPLDSAKRRNDESHNADVSVPSVPARPLSLVRLLEQGQTMKNTSFQPNHFNSMLESPTQQSLLNISSPNKKPNARTKSIQVLQKSRH